MISSIYSNKLDSETKSPAKALTYAYIIAFAIIAVFSIGIHFSTNLLMQELTETSEVTYHMSRIRSMLQRVPYQVDDFAEHGSDVDQARLKNTLQKIEASRTFIVPQIQEGHSISDELTEVFFGARFNLDERLKIYVQISRECSNINIQYLNPSKVCKKIGEALGNMDAREMIAGFDVGLDKYRQETLATIDFYHRMQMGGIVIILLVLILEAFLIFRPLINRIHNYHTMLVEQALQDPLTGLKNRRAFINESTAEVAQSKRSKAPIGMALMDLDKFKSINDTYGHDVGDAVIKHFASQLKMRVRRGDIIGRIGGEEFAVTLVRSTSDQDAYNVIDRIRAAVAESPCPYKDKNGETKELSYSVSVGIYSCTPDEESVNEMLTKADEMLYEAKEGGRNQVVLVNAEGKNIRKEDQPEQPPVPQAKA